jgi:hypothetical protein
MFLQYIGCTAQLNGFGGKRLQMGRPVKSMFLKRFSMVD